MLLFRDEEHVDRWCDDRRVPRGAVVTVEQAWRLAQPWYADRLDYEWTPRPPDGMERLLTAAGLTGEFWRVR
jgi:hypothetical protein